MKLTLDGAPRPLEHDGSGIIRLLSFGLGVDTNEV